MKYKGYELLKAIADGEIKKNQNIRIKFEDNSGEIFIFDGTEIIDITHKNIFDIYGTITVLKSDFELIEDEIDIDSIKEIKWTEINGTGDEQDKFILEKNGRYICTNYDDFEMELIRTTNQLVQAVKQLKKEEKELKKI